MLMQDLSVIAPELALVIFALGALMWGAFAGGRDPSGLILWISTGLLVAAGLWIGFQPEGERLAFDGSFVSDGFARFSKVMILFGAAATLALGHDYLVRAKLMKFEYPVLIVFAVVGMMVMVSARDLIVLYMGLELQSLALYIVASFRRDSLRSTEAGLKYFVLGALSSGMLLYGASLTYGFSGTTSFAGITAVIGLEERLPLGLLFGLVFLAAGMAFKLSAAPFHMWTPDVYEGSPTPVTAFFSTAPKVAAAAMFARVLFDAFGGAVGEWQQILVFLSVASMFLGAFAAIGQTNIKRLMAYSSISHMGFALMGLAAGTGQGAQSLLIYLAIYVTMNVGVFAFILNMERDGKPVTDIASLGLYSQVHPARAACLAVLMFSLAGVPPLVGFFGKFYVLMAAVDAGLFWLAIGGVIASVISAYYYLRIVFLMYFGEAAQPLEGRMPNLHWALLGVSALAMVFGIVNLFGIEPLAASAAATLVQSTMADWPGRYGRDVRVEIDSTNAEALRRAADGVPGPVWILSHRQSAARGRRGRPWVSPPGNFSATLLIRPDGSPSMAALRSFVAALALRDALVAATGRPALFALKWPNDVLLAERKLAGILLEASGGALAIGFGVNLATAPDPADVERGAVPPVALAEATGVRVGPEAFLDLLALAFDGWESRLAREGFAPLREAWLGHAARIGQTITARLPGCEVTGTFETIDGTGALVLGTASGRIALPAAEVHFGTVESGGLHAARD